MAYRFEVEESTRESFRRCARDELDRAIRELTEGVKAIRSRRCTKRARR